MTSKYLNKNNSRSAKNSFLMNENIEKLSQLATIALTSPVKEDRESAEDELRFLSSFESWEFLKEIFPRVQNNYLLFILSKCFSFIVKNELGTDERNETLSMMLKYLASYGAGENAVLPTFVRREVYTVIASAFHSNWKIGLVMNAAEQDSEEVCKASSQNLVEDLVIAVQALPPLYRMECLREILLFQCDEITKGYTLAIAKTASIQAFFPLILDSIVDHVAYFPDLVLDVSVTVLSTIFGDESGGEGTLKGDMEKFYACLSSWRSSNSNSRGKIWGSPSGFHNSQNYERVSPDYRGLQWKNWDRPLRVLVDYCFRAFTLGEVTAETRQHAGRFLQVCAAVDPKASIGPFDDSFVLNCLDLSRKLLSRTLAVATGNHIQDHKEDAVLALTIVACAKKHSRNSLIQFLEASPETLSHWGEYFATLQMCDDPAEEDIYQCVLSYFCDLCTLLPPSSSLKPSDPRDAVGKHYGNNPNSGGGTIAADGMPKEGVPSPSLCGTIMEHATSAFICALDHILKCSYMSNGTSEALLDEGAGFYNERVLELIAELLFGQGQMLFPLLEEKLAETINYYRIFHAMKEKARPFLSENAQAVCWSPEEELALSSFIALSPPCESKDLGISCLNSGSSFLQALEMQGGTFNVHRLIRFNLLACLSRLSAVIFIFGIAISKRRIPISKSVLEYVISFSFPLLDSDSTLTETLMENLSVESKPKVVQDVGEGDQTQELHFGIIRSLFFFCHSVFKSQAGEEEEKFFSDVTLSLLRFVYLYHSDEPSLVKDANSLLESVLPVRNKFNDCVSSEKIMAVLDAVRENRIQLLQRNFLSSSDACSRGSNGTHRKHGGEKYIQDCRSARFSFLRIISMLIESRFYEGYSVFDVLERLVRNQLTPEGLELYPVESLGNILAITCGCSQPDTFFAVINMVLHNASAVAGAIRRAMSYPLGPRYITQWCCKVSVLSRSFEKDCERSYFTYEVLTFLMQAILTYFQWLSSDGENGVGRNGETDGLAKVEDNGDGRGRLFVEHAASEVYKSSSISFSVGYPNHSRFSFPKGAMNVDCIYDMFELLETMSDGAWCKLGVVAYYDRSTLSSLFNGVIQAFLSTPPELLMSDCERRAKVFHSLALILNDPSEALSFIFNGWIQDGILQEILDHISRCLHCFFMPIIVSVILGILKLSEAYESEYLRAESGSVGDIPAIQPKVLVKAFRAVILVILTAPYLELSQTNDCFRVLFSVFHRAEAETQRLLARLLDDCTAYHRVRIRLIMSSLRGKEASCAENYFSYFGQRSKLEVLTAW